MQSTGKTSWTRLLVVSIIGVALLAMADRQALAQGPEKVSPEVQQLKENLQKLEQTVQELKTQLTEMEQPGLAPVVAKSAQQTSSTTTELYAATTKPKQEDKEGESTFEAYGFAMLDMGFQFKTEPSGLFRHRSTTKLPAFKDQFATDGKTYFGVRQSRFGVKSTTATRFGELKTTFEFELFGSGVDAGQTTFRLQHG